MKKIVALLLCLLLCLSSLTFAAETWTCPACGDENGDDCLFCGNCGAKRVSEWICPACGRANKKNFCTGCGAAKPAEGGTAYKVGDIVTFGTYAGKPIEWQVLEVQGDTCLLITVEGLDAMPYHTKFEDVPWENCSLRAWLNGEFYETAFTESEKDRIQLTTLENPGYEKYNIPADGPTEDRVFLLDVLDVDRYFPAEYHAVNDDYMSEAVLCMPSARAVQNGAKMLSQKNLSNSSIHYPLKEGACRWWLRTSCRCNSGAAFAVDNDGTFGRYGFMVSDNTICIRPVIRVKL